MPSDADYAAMAYGRGNRDPHVVELVEETIAREREESENRKRALPSVTLPEPEGWLANAILGCLRTWERQSGPGPWVVTIGDIEYLAKWAANLQQQYEKTGRQFKVTTYPERVR